MSLRVGIAVFVCSLATAGTSTAGIISAQTYANDAAFGAALASITSLTGALPNLGDVGTSEVVGDATLSAGDTIFIDNTWSTLIPGNEVAISGVENLNVALNTSTATAFGFYFHEPGSSTAHLDGCNTTCVDSTFMISFYLSNVLVDSTTFSPANDALVFFGIILNMPFDEVRFVETVGTNDNEFYGEMYVGQAPEPTTLVLFGSALGLLAARRRARRA